MTGKVLFRNASSIQNSSQDIGPSHSHEIPKDNGKYAVIEPFQNVDMNESDNSIASNKSK